MVQRNWGILMTTIRYAWSRANKSEGDRDEQKATGIVRAGRGEKVYREVEERSV